MSFITKHVEINQEFMNTTEISKHAQAYHPTTLRKKNRILYIDFIFLPRCLCKKSIHYKLVHVARRFRPWT